MDGYDGRKGTMSRTLGLQILVKNYAWSLKASHAIETNKTSSGLFIPKPKPQNGVIWRLNSIQICCASNMEKWHNLVARKLNSLVAFGRKAARVYN